MERIVERPGALDVHRASVTACVRVWHERELTEHVAEFATTVAGLLALRDWLEALEVKQVAMEATGVYWRPVWAVLEDHFALLLVNARHVKQVPGRKTDVKDAQWLGQLVEAGLLRPSLVPPKPIRTLRNLTRYRKTQINDRQREAARLHKILEDTGIKLGCVASDIMGKSGRDMLDALVRGTTDPVVLADLARGQLRKKIPALRDALQGRFDGEHALIVGQILAHIDFLDEAIERLSDAIEVQIAPFARQRDLLMSIPGVKQRTAEVLIAETGADMSAFPSAKHLASWAGMCPGNDQSAGKRRSARAPTGSAPRRPLDPPRRLAHAADRRARPRPRRRLLHPPTPRPPHQAPHPTTRSPRTPRHARTQRGGRLTRFRFSASSDNSKPSDTTSRSNPERWPSDEISLQGALAAKPARHVVTVMATCATPISVRIHPRR